MMNDSGMPAPQAPQGPAFSPPQMWTPPVAGKDANFWNATESLRFIYQWSLARLLSPYVVLLSVLARIVTAVPPHIVLPPIIGSTPASLNLDVCVVGYSGQGKDKGIEAAETLVPDIRGAEVTDVSSGEGVVAVHSKRVLESREGPDAGSTVSQKTFRNAPRNIRAVLLCTEAANLAAQIGRRDNTLVGVLNQAWCGSRLGGAVKDQENNLFVPANGYREALIVASQPAYVGMLAAQHGNGFFQRLVWADAFDARISKVPTLNIVHGRIEVPECGRFPFDSASLPADLDGDAYANLFLAGSRDRMINPDRYPLMQMRFPIEAWTDVVEFRKQHNRPDIDRDDPDAHRLLIQMKLAAALHFLGHDHGGLPCDLDVGLRDWRLAAHLMRYSAAVRTRAEEQGRKSKRTDTAKAITDRIAASDMADAEVLRNAKKRILKVLDRDDPGREGLASRYVRSSLNTTQRRQYLNAINELKDEELIDFRKGPEGGEFYSLHMA